MAKIAAFRKKEKDYTDKMKAAELAATQKKYDAAIGFYEEARDLKPTEPIPTERIAALTKVRDANASANQLEQKYQEQIRKANKSFAEREYVTALSYYNKSLEYKKDDATALAKIEEIKQILDDNAKVNMANAEKKKAFDKFIKRADELFENEQWQEAKNVYAQALSIDNQSPYAKRQLEECVSKMKQARYKEQEALYRKIIAAGDKNLASEDYTKAIDYYGRAVKMRNDDPYPRLKLVEIDNILNPKIVDNGKLKPLGDSFEGDAALALAKASSDQKLDAYVLMEDVRDKVESDEQINSIYDKNGNIRAQEGLDFVKTDIRKDIEDFEDAEKQSLAAAKQEILLMNRSNEKMERITTNSKFQMPLLWIVRP